MTFRLSYEAAVQINQTVTGDCAIRDSGSLDAALNRPYATGYGEELFPAFVEKAAVLLHGIATSHPFIDGNKRTALMSCLTVLELNGLRVADDGTGGPMVLALVDERQDHRRAAFWLTAHLL